jgi:hypothetical protein
MGLDRRFRQHQRCRDLGVRPAAGDRAQYLSLSRGRPMRIGWSVAGNS